MYVFADKFDYVEARSFIDSYNDRLPELKPYFMNAANEFGFDWRLLAAVSYQESHWKNSARSPTGVRGLMMLTQADGAADRHQRPPGPGAERLRRRQVPDHPGGQDTRPDPRPGPHLVRPGLLQRRLTATLRTPG